MTRPNTIFRSVAAVSLIVTMFAAFSVTGSAQVTNPDTFPDFFTWDTNECYFASVGNGDDFGLGAAQTSITIQNLSGEEGVAYILVGTGDGFDEATFAGLQPGASKTFTGDVTTDTSVNPNTSTIQNVSNFLDLEVGQVLSSPNLQTLYSPSPKSKSTSSASAVASSTGSRSSKRTS